jgi:hypothetical protein
VDQGGGLHPDPAEFTVAAQQAASARASSVVSAHTAGQIVSIVTVLAVDQPAAVTVALAVVSGALKRPVVSPTPLTLRVVRPSDCDGSLTPTPAGRRASRPRRGAVSRG